MVSTPSGTTEQRGICHLWRSSDEVRVTVYDHKSHDAPCELRKEVVDTVRQWLKGAGMVEDHSDELAKPHTCHWDKVDGSTKVGCHTYCKIVESLHAAKNPKTSA